MRLGTRIVGSGVGLLLLATISVSIYLLNSMAMSLDREMILRAQTFTVTISELLRGPAASNRIEELDDIVFKFSDNDLDRSRVRFIAVLDAQSRLVAHTDQNQVGTLLFHPFITLATHSDKEHELKMDWFGERLLLCSQPLETHIGNKPGIRWGTLVTGHVDDFFDKSILPVLYMTIPIILLMTIALAVIMIWTLRHTVVVPLCKLASVAENFANGDLSVRVPPSPYDKFAAVGNTLNDMALRIENQTRHLEAEIRSRTSELESANRQLKELATTDALTGLFNRRHFETSLDLEIRRSKRLNAPVSLLMIDVDHFKNFNDTYGHQAGDEILKDISRHLRNRVRSTDIVCRFGGEEFCALLTATDKDLAHDVAEELRDRIATTPFPMENTQTGVRLTISIGVATYPNDTDSGEGLVAVADAALYKAKAGGRNRVSVHSKGETLDNHF